MVLNELHTRIIENRDWATLVFVFSLVLIVMAKSTFESRFNDFIRLIVSDKYTKIYRESSHLVSGFNVLFFVVNLVSLSFFSQIAVVRLFDYGEITDWVLFVRVFTLIMVFILCKFLIEKIIAVTFGIEEIIEQFNLQKVNFRTYIGLLLLPVSIILFYGNYTSKLPIMIVVFVLLTINLLSYLILLKNYQNLLFSKLFYIILYLCALEIAPYYFIYYLISKN
ncbi:MAG: DUF4271 domain-containing protein [Sphingobacteriales bacterium]|nr:DUF4271 domain-containing protein [Sphingobacteriales bacterium]